ncbi:cation diffusion facilitator family transporter [Kurthia sibirica]|uniref:Cation transporter n=1 Tax=Kurthia sibirica TaxID=202750 RepID=A0A2U3AND3_9BACL|nr:cation diffusion facilitator family transporter [Kurthia sibirica]PWI26053.1 hypothetical protein DEX24_05860 [Kurthia sibirica]GEK34796.1 cation transporter [Kurthia sibirica]
MFDLDFKKTSKSNNHFVKIALSLLFIAMILSWIGAAKSQSITQIVVTAYLFSMIVLMYANNTIETVVERAFSLKRSYSYFRFEVLTALILAITLAVSGLYMLFLVLPQQVTTNSSNELLAYSIVTAVIVAVAMSFAFIKQQQTRINKILKSFYSMIPPFIAAAVAIYSTTHNSPTLERLATLLIILFILRNCWLIMKRSCHFLMEGTPQKLDLIQLTSDLQAFDHVLRVQGISAWSISTNLFGIKCQIVINNIERSQFIVDEITDFIINHYNVEHISFEIINSTSEGKI